MQFNPHRDGYECLTYGTVCNGIHVMKDKDMSRDKQEQNTRYFYIALVGLGLLMLVAQVCMYIGYKIGEWLL